MKTARAHGFTLIELLTVIAIISILAAITTVAAPRIIERARISNTQSAMNDLRTALSTYYADHGSFPPGYGYLLHVSQAGETYHNVIPYTMRLGIHRNFNHYDPFSESHDTNMDGQISLLEFTPFGAQAGPGQYSLPVNRFLPGNPPADTAEDLQRQLNEQRPFVYIPVNSRQAELVSNFYHRNQNYDFRERMYAQVWDDSEGWLARVNIPPAGTEYDRFVLISVGPDQNTSGLLPEPLGGEPNETVYDITALRAYFLATRDLRGDGNPDFDFIARTREGAGDPMAYPEYDPDGSLQLNLLPDGSNRGGPMILQY